MIYFLFISLTRNREKKEEIYTSQKYILHRYTSHFSVQYYNKYREFFRYIFFKYYKFKYYVTLIIQRENSRNQEIKQTKGRYQQQCREIERMKKVKTEKRRNLKMKFYFSSFMPFRDHTKQSKIFRHNLTSKGKDDFLRDCRACGNFTTWWKKNFTWRKKDSWLYLKHMCTILLL